MIFKWKLANKFTCWFVMFMQPYCSMSFWRYDGSKNGDYADPLCVCELIYNKSWSIDYLQKENVYMWCFIMSACKYNEHPLFPLAIVNIWNLQALGYILNDFLKLCTLGNLDRILIFMMHCTRVFIFLPRIFAITFLFLILVKISSEKFVQEDIPLFLQDVPVSYLLSVFL